jgi:GTPase SAR1 family protein
MDCDVKGQKHASQFFEGRKDILAKMLVYFHINNHTSAGTARQLRFVLFGLGGAGKTQVALKFIEEAGDR